MTISSSSFIIKKTSFVYELEKKFFGLDGALPQQSGKAFGCCFMWNMAQNENILYKESFCVPVWYVMYVYVCLITDVFSFSNRNIIHDAQSGRNISE